MLVERIEALKQAMKMEQHGKAYYEKADKRDGEHARKGFVQPEGAFG